ncbi:hypothetical protein CHUAL_005786 [Chamberlinius hualienensis]
MGETVGLLCPQYFRLLTEGLWHQFEKQDGTDLTIRFSGSQICVHRFLFTIFAPHMLDESMDSTLDLSNVEMDQEIIASMLEFLYKGQVIILKDKLELLKLGAGKLGLGLVVDAIDQFFQPKLSEVGGKTEMFGNISEEGTNLCLEATSSTGNAEMVDVSELEWCEVTIEAPSINLSSEKVEPSEEKHVIGQTNMDLWDLCLDNNLKDISDEVKDTEQPVIVEQKKVFYKCSYCCYKSADKTSLKKHLTGKHRLNIAHKSKKLYKCSDCNFSAEQRLILSRHVQNNHSTDRPFACDQCNYKAKTMIDLKYHLKRHMGIKFNCEICNKKCSSYSGLCQHRKLHMVREKRNVCHLCGYASSRKGDLNKHLTNVHGYVPPKISNNSVSTSTKLFTGKTTEYKCQHCDYKTKIRVRWRNHLAAQHRIDWQGNSLEPTVYCDQCDFKCLLQYQLAGHKAKMHPTKLYECEECDHVTHLKANLDVHIKSKHRDDRPFVCQACAFTTKTSSQLKSHMRSHSNEKFLCDLCNNSYSSKQHLKRHLVVMHDPNARKHNCYLCAFVTKTKDALSQHIKRMHKS